MDPRFSPRNNSGSQEKLNKLFASEEIVAFGDRDPAIVEKIKKKCSMLPSPTTSSRADEIYYMSLSLFDRFGGTVAADDLNIFLTYIVCISWSRSRGDRGLLYPGGFDDILNADTDTHTHVDVVKEDSVWGGKAKQMYEGKPVSPFDFLEFLYPMAHLPPDRSPVTEMLAKSREDADFAKFLPSTLAVSAILAYASGGGFGEGVRNWFRTEVMQLDWFNNEERRDEIEERKGDIDKCTYEMETLYEMLHPKKNNDGLGCCACTLQ